MFKSLLSRKYERRIDKRKKTLPVCRKFIKKLQEDLIIMKRTTKREGFTLVELLIVIVVIGILSAMMMLSSTEAVSSARANNIIANLRNLKTAALAWYVDSLDIIERDSIEPTTANHFKYVKHYLNNDTASDLSNYGIAVKDKKWYVYCDNTNNQMADANVRTKLKGRAASTGLLKMDGSTYPTYDGTEKKNIAVLVR